MEEGPKKEKEFGERGRGEAWREEGKVLWNSREWEYFCQALRSLKGVVEFISRGKVRKSGGKGKSCRISLSPCLPLSLSVCLFLRHCAPVLFTRPGLQSAGGGRSLSNTRENSPERYSSDSESNGSKRGISDRAHLAAFARHSR